MQISYREQLDTVKSKLPKKAKILWSDVKIEACRITGINKDQFKGQHCLLRQLARVKSNSTGSLGGKETKKSMRLGRLAACASCLLWLPDKEITKIKALLEVFNNVAVAQI